MEGQAIIHGGMTIQEINRTYPAARAVFERFGLAGCGGPLGPPETVAFFARAHQVDEADLLAELNQAAQGGRIPAVTIAAPGPADNRLYRYFIRTALLITLSLGSLWGVVLLTQISLQRNFEAVSEAAMQAHGHAQIFGWVGLFIMGVLSHTLPRFTGTILTHPRLVLVSLVLMTAGVILRAGLPLLAGGAGETAMGGLVWLAPFSAVLELVALSLFIGVMGQSLRGGQPSGQAPKVPGREPYTGYILSSLAWWWLTVAINLPVTWVMARGGSLTVAHDLGHILLHLQLYGFITLMIFGVSLRILPVFLGLAPTHPGMVRPVLVALNGSLVLKVLAWALPWLGQAASSHSASLSQQLSALAVLLEWGAIAAFVHGLNLLKKPQVDLSISGVDPTFQWFIKAAYLWLLLAESMLTGYTLYEAATGLTLSHLLLGAYRHTLTIGFITTMIMGVGYRVIPIFSGTTMARPTVIRLSFVLINLGTLMRATLGLAAEGNPSLLPAMGLSGFLQLAAIALFAYALWRAMAGAAALEQQTEPAEVRGDEPLGPETRVRSLIRAHPQAVGILVQHGLTNLQNPAIREQIPVGVTLGIACKVHGIPLEPLLRALQGELNEKGS